MADSVISEILLKELPQQDVCMHIHIHCIYIILLLSNITSSLYVMLLTMYVS